MDREAIEAIGKERLRQKVATVVFFESSGGTARAEAPVPEIRLSVGHPDLDLGNIETALDALTAKGYYFIVERKNYKYSLNENLNKRFSDKRRKTGNWTRLTKAFIKLCFPRCICVSAR